MRVISGTARGRKLKEPVGSEIRPTGDLVKESIFNIIQFDVEGRRVLDLFAGTGQLGIEALSRGAKSAVFVDSKPEAVMLIRENLRICGLTDSAVIHTRDVLRYLGSGHDARYSQRESAEVRGTQRGKSPDRAFESEKFDIIFIDPPYSTDLAAETIQKIIKFDNLDTNGIMICETSACSALPDVAPPYILQREYIYGKVKVARFTRGIQSERQCFV